LPPTTVALHVHAGGFHFTTSVKESSCTGSGFPHASGAVEEVSKQSLVGKMFTFKVGGAFTSPTAAVLCK